MTEEFGRLAPRSTLTFVTMLVASSLVALMGFLLFDNYQTAASLQRTLLERMHQETAQRVVSLDYFFGERRSDLANLARSREVGVFFENRALGMSLRYGLKQSLIPIKQLFDELIERKRIASALIFDRLVLVDEAGQVLVDTNLDGITIGAGKLPACNRPQDEGGAILTQDDGQSLIVSMPYRFKDDYAAQIVGWIRPSVLYDHLLGIDGDAQALGYLLTEPAAKGGLRLVGSGVPNSWSKLLAQINPDFATMPGEFAEQNRAVVPGADLEVYVSALQVPRTNFTLVELNPIETVEGGLNPWGQVLGVGVLAVLVLSGIAFVFQANLRFAKLEARLSEAALREQQIQAKNAALKVEVAERRRAVEAMQEAKEAAEAASKAKTDFLANMSHEIRTPMVGVIGMTGLLRDTHLSEQQKEYVNTIRSSGDALLEVINDILDFSKIEANRMELKITGFDLRTILAEVADILALRAFDKGLNFNCLLPEGIPVRLRGDSGRLRQVLINLIGNAIKFTEHGEVSVHVRHIDQKASHTHCLLRFEVNDTGIGIPADHRNRLFESFFQVDMSTTRRFGGTGLGLAISKQLVELMGGHIGCDSHEGQGSTFWVEIPFQIDVHAPELIDESAQALDDQLASQVSLRVLVAEDNPTNQKVALSMLQRLGHHADVVGNGGEALDALKLLPYDLVLMDVQMPEMDGLEATRRFRALEKGTGRHLPIVAMTAHASLADRERCLNAGMDDFITKPVQRGVLGKIITVNFEKHNPEGFMSSSTEQKPDVALESIADAAGLKSTTGTSEAPTDGPVFTFDVMVERLDNDEEIAREIAEIFVSSSAELLQDLAAAVSVGDAELIRARAHSIKGSAGNIGAEALQDAAGAMECAGRDSDLEAAQRLLPRLSAALEQVNRVLSDCG